jgi:hypothetical protein
MQGTQLLNFELLKRVIRLLDNIRPTRRSVQNSKFKTHQCGKPMKLHQSISLAAASLFVLLSPLLLAAAESKPNVLVFLCDDTGYAEFGFQGGKDIPTPHIDSIAKNGVRFTQGYVSGPYCSPTRAGLLTGRYQTRFGHEFNSTARQSGLALDETTMAEHFRDLGYATCAIGKWHLGERPRFRPTRQGFDEFYGTLANSAFFRPRQFMDTRVSQEVQRVDDPDFYTTDAYGERAVDWIGRHDRRILGSLPEHSGRKAPHLRRDDVGDGRCGRQDS